MLRIIILLIVLKGALMAIEEPQYTVIKKNDAFEIRKYAPYLVAQTEVTGTFEEMGTKAFRILVKYISGENQKRSKIKMTAPVIQEPIEDNGIKIQMTEPVIQELDQTNPQSAIFSFVMPQKFTLDTLPLPLDKRITLREIPAKTVAVREYSGSWGEEKYKENETILLQALHDVDVSIIGKPNFARYNSPFALWFMRRNEIMVEIQR